MAFFDSAFFKKPFFKNEFYGEPFFLDPFFTNTTIAHPYTAGTFDASTVRVVCSHPITGTIDGKQLKITIDGTPITDGIIAQSGHEFDVDISPVVVTSGQKIRLSILADPSNNLGKVSNGIVVNNVV